MEGAEILQPMGPPAKGLGQWQAQLKQQYLTEIGTADMIGLGHMTLAALGRAGVGWLRGHMDARYEDVVARTRPLLLRRFSVEGASPSGVAVPSLLRRGGQRS